MDQDPTSHGDDPDHGLLQDPDDAELETVSLCDLPLYSDEYECERHQFSSSLEIDHGDPFEFSSEDLSASWSKMCMAENIIFCGRLIHYGREPPSLSGGPSEAQGKVGGVPQPQKKKWKLFKRRLSLFRKHRHCSSKSHDVRFSDRSGAKKEHRSTRLECSPSEKYSRYVPEKCMDKYGFSMRRLPAQSGRVKCRWYLLMFGSARFPMEMELQDMKTRQSRRNLYSTFQSFSTDGGNIIGSGNCDGKGNRNRGLWRLLRALSCSSDRQCGSAAITKLS
ncbi:uncharacterized protein LOC116188335 [Punica granatum]|uniref:Membrane-associated kinase regulator 6 n=2 Tax=Punica granatum TaxID=22663 RepID=A0A218XRX3_PUNGR|nr:uncharacterized protein LOC116188335 [Punica granatum]OWM87570.1 hypothetical protein CDL15_Pgr022682 [Punica granatum]PKI74624.1 hypothetical protein CRG98_004951 [Punica granatum]